MSRTAFTIRVFGYYSLLTGAILLLVPNLMLALSGFPPATEIWIRVLGVALFNVGIYYISAARSDARAFFQASVYTRVFAFLSLGAFAVLGLANARLVLFGVVEVLGALWTLRALRQDSLSAASA